MDIHDFPNYSKSIPDGPPSIGSSSTELKKDANFWSKQTRVSNRLLKAWDFPMSVSFPEPSDNESESLLPDIGKLIAQNEMYALDSFIRGPYVEPPIKSRH